MKKQPAVHTLLKKPATAVSLKKAPIALILKGDNAYICCMCGVRYGTAEEAWQCVTNNVLLLKTIPVVAFGSQSDFYHCLLCSRKYLSHQDAVLCLQADIKKEGLHPAVRNYLAGLVSATICLDTHPKQTAASCPQAKNALQSPPSSSRVEMEQAHNVQKQTGVLIADTTNFSGKLPNDDELVVEYNNINVMPELSLLKSELLAPTSKTPLPDEPILEGKAS